MATGTARPMALPNVPLAVRPGASVRTRAADSITTVASARITASEPGGS